MVFGWQSMQHKRCTTYQCRDSETIVTNLRCNERFRNISAAQALQKAMVDGASAVGGGEISCKQGEAYSGEQRIINELLRKGLNIANN